MFLSKTKQKISGYFSNEEEAIIEVNVFIRSAILMVIGIVILSAVVSAVVLGNDSPFQGLLNSTISGIESGYSLLVIILIVIAAAGILRYLNVI